MTSTVKNVGSQTYAKPATVKLIGYKFDSAGGHEIVLYHGSVPALAPGKAFLFTVDTPAWVYAKTTYNSKFKLVILTQDQDLANNVWDGSGPNPPAE